MNKCKVEECEKPVWARNYCSGHYSKWKYHNGYRTKKKCSVDECENNVFGHGLCQKHYKRMKKHGTTKSQKTYVSEKDIVLEWDFLKNKKKPSEVPTGSGKKYWWKCGICNFSWTATPLHRVHKGTGCPKCNASHGEKYISWWLKKNNFKFYVEKKFPECRNKKELPFDFCVYIGNNIFLIEYDGVQHFEEVEMFGGKSAFKKRVENDKIKNKFCEQNNIPLLRIPYFEENIDGVLENFIGGLQNG